MPITAMPEGKIVCIGGDGGGLNSDNSNSLLRLNYPKTIDIISNNSNSLLSPELSNLPTDVIRVEWRVPWL